MTLYNPLSTTYQRIQKTILIVEDDEAIRLLLEDAFALEPSYHTVFTTNGTETGERIRGIDLSLFVLNYHLPDTNGIALYDELHTTPGLEKVPALLVSASLPYAIGEEIKKRNITVLQKPFGLKTLLQLIKDLAT